MTGLVDSRAGGIRPIVAQDVTDGTNFRGVINFGVAPVDLTFLSVGSTPNTVTIAAGSMYPFSFKVDVLPAGELYGYINYTNPQ